MSRAGKKRFLKLDPGWAIGACTSRSCGHTAPYHQRILHRGSEQGVNTQNITCNIITIIYSLLNI